MSISPPQKPRTGDRDGALGVIAEAFIILNSAIALCFICVPIGFALYQLMEVMHGESEAEKTLKKMEKKYDWL